MVIRTREPEAKQSVASVPDSSGDPPPMFAIANGAEGQTNFEQKTGARVTLTVDNVAAHGRARSVETPAGDGERPLDESPTGPLHG